MQYILWASVLISSAILIAAAAWAAVAVTKMLQIMLATNAMIIRELDSARQSMQMLSPPLGYTQSGTSGGSGASRVPYPDKPSKADQEGEFHPYDEIEIAENQRVEELRRRHMSEQGDLSDDALNGILASKGVEG
jgi:hypothetical protein